MNIESAAKRLSDTPPERVVFFVGAGLCLDLGYPTWKGLIEKLSKVVSKDDENAAAIMEKRLTKMDILRAADPAYFPEVAATTRVNFFKDLFGSPPSLKRRHRLLGRLPIAAFVTTNFDLMIETAIALPGNTANVDEQRVFLAGRLPSVFNGTDRFARFNSELPMYSERYTREVNTRALVLKIHNDINDCEHLGFTSESLSALKGEAAFRHFYNELFSKYTVVFVGFGGYDPNLLQLIAEYTSAFAGYGSKDCFFFLPSDTPLPDPLTSIHFVRHIPYDPKDDHKAIELLLKQLSDVWLGPDLENRIKRQDPPSPVAEDAKEGINLFSLMATAIDTDTDLRLVDAIAEFMIRDAAATGRSHDEQTIVNQLSQRFLFSPSRAQELVTRYPLTHYLPSLAPPSKEKRIQDLLAVGIRKRALAVDASFVLAIERLRPIVQELMSAALQTYGGNVALSLVKAERPSQTVLAEVLRDIISVGRWQGVGPTDRECLRLAISDLFLNPTREEAVALTQLSNVAVALGLLNGLPDLHLIDEISPDFLFLDTTCILPLLTAQKPRATAIFSLADSARTDRTRVIFLDSFLDEVNAHFKNAIALLRDANVKAVNDLRKLIEASDQVDEFINVFVLYASRREHGENEQPLNVLQVAFGNGGRRLFRKLVESHGIEVATFPFDKRISDDLGTQILHGKENWYDRRFAARTILAKNEGIQLAVIEALAADGKRAWFATDDSQLRRLVRRFKLSSLGVLLPVAGAAGLYRSIGTGRDLTVAFPRLLWSPGWQDRADEVVGKVIRELLPRIPEDMRLPIEEARALAAESLRKRAKSTTDNEHDLDAKGPSALSADVRLSVFRMLGERIEAERERRGLDPARPVAAKHSSGRNRGRTKARGR